MKNQELQNGKIGILTFVMIIGMMTVGCSSGVVKSNFSERPLLASALLETSNSDIQRAYSLIEINQVDPAIVSLEKGLENEGWAKAHPDKWELGFKQLLGLTVEVKNDPNLTLELISKFLESKGASSQFKTEARIWRSHVKQWRNEKPEQKNQASRAKVLLELAKKESGNSGLIYVLRANHLSKDPVANAKNSNAHPNFNSRVAESF